MEKKRGILYWLRVILCLFAIIAMGFRFAGIKVSADAELTLTPSQTLALFGTELQAIIYTEVNGSPRTVTFDYAFTLNDIGYMSEGGGFMEQNLRNSINHNVITSNSVYEEIIDYCSNTNGLVYVASSSQWGGTNIRPYYGTSYPAQLHIPFSISLSGISGIEQAIHYSSLNEDRFMANSLPGYQDNKLKYLFTGDDVEVDSFPGVYYSYFRTARYLLPSYPFYSGTVDESQLCTLSGFYINTELQPESFDCTGITLDAYCLGSSQLNSNDLWIVVQCPHLWEYTPPVVTTTDAPTTFPTQTFPTATVPTGTDYDPHKIIIDNQNTQIMQLNLIIGQLDRIYNRMVNSGQIAVNLMPAEPLAELRTDIHSQIHDSLSSFTTARLPDEVGNGFSFFNELYSRFTSGPLAFFGWLGIFSLMSLVLSWLIFRGRG